MNLGISFVTGRKSFKRTLNTYVNNWVEHNLIDREDINIHVFIVYDLNYENTLEEDFKNLPATLRNKVKSINYFGEKEIADEIERLCGEGVLERDEAKLIFGSGYGRKRNVAMYFAVKRKMDKLMFLDDDEYPLAGFQDENKSLAWKGQSVVGTHIELNDEADITHGHHCGYLSPIPCLNFNEILTKEDFRLYIEAISNEIVSWESVDHLTTNHKGVTYACPDLLQKQPSFEVEEEMGMKFISGANLCFNLKNHKNLPPFYNPPGARGEDTFMSTLLTNLKVIKVPCYTFHDGFEMYHGLLSGVLPVQLAGIYADNPKVVRRFLNASLGWVRYKPLLVYITNKENFTDVMNTAEQKLELAIPKLCRFFKTNEFKKVLSEFKKYKELKDSHFEEFGETVKIWKRLMS